TLLLAYLIEPSRPEYPLEEPEAEYGLGLEPDPRAEEGTAALVRNAAATLRLRALLLERVRERGGEPLCRAVERRVSPVLAAMDDDPEPPGHPHPPRARPRDPLGTRRGARAQVALGRLLADRVADPRARFRRAEVARGVRARRGHPHGDGGRGPRRRARGADL